MKIILIKIGKQTNKSFKSFFFPSKYNISSNSQETTHPQSMNSQQQTIGKEGIMVIW